MSQTISLNLSTNAMMQEIYATSALRCLNTGAKSRPAILTSDQRSALALLIKDAFAFVILKVIPYVEHCNLLETTEQLKPEEDEILSVDFRMPQGVSSSVVTAMRVALQIGRAHV